jgi:hypothetical protein
MKSVRLIEAFATGCGGRIASTWSARLEPGAAAFYGMRRTFIHLMRQARDEGRDLYYIDNSYFDCVREKQFRITRNALQADGLHACWSGDGPARLRALGVTIKPWRELGDHIVVCPQSNEYMELVGWEGDWLDGVTDALKKHTARRLLVRRKAERRPLSEDLRGAWALVAHSSAAAVEAIIAGVPAFCTGICAAQWMGASDLSLIESPVYPDRRQEWAEVLAENQWTADEMRDGTAWKALQ